MVKNKIDNSGARLSDAQGARITMDSLRNLLYQACHDSLWDRSDGKNEMFFQGISLLVPLSLAVKSHTLGLLCPHWPSFSSFPDIFNLVIGGGYEAMDSLSPI